jgi:hypothetical protein
MPDPFDPRFVAAADRMARDAAARFGGASYLIGYFVDNEVNWGKDWSNDPRERNSVAIGALAADRESPAKSAFIEQLVETYRLPERLGDVRGTDLLLG